MIAERVDWTRSLNVLKDRVRELRHLYLSPDLGGCTQYRPCELAPWAPVVPADAGAAGDR